MYVLLCQRWYPLCGVHSAVQRCILTITIVTVVWHRDMCAARSSGNNGSFTSGPTRLCLGIYRCTCSGAHFSMWCVGVCTYVCVCARVCAFVCVIPEPCGYVYTRRVSPRGVSLTTHTYTNTHVRTHTHALAHPKANKPFTHGEVSDGEVHITNCCANSFDTEVCVSVCECV